MGWRYYLYLHKKTGWTYLAIVMDLFDLKIIDWSYGLNMNDDLVLMLLTKQKQTEDFLKTEFFILIVEANIRQTNLKRFLVIMTLNILIVKKVILMITRVW